MGMFNPTSCEIAQIPLFDEKVDICGSITTTEKLDKPRGSTWRMDFFGMFWDPPSEKEKNRMWKQYPSLF